MRPLIHLTTLSSSPSPCLSPSAIPTTYGFHFSPPCFIYSFRPNKRFHFFAPCSSLKQIKKQSLKKNSSPNTAPRGLKGSFSAKSDDDNGGGGREKDGRQKNGDVELEGDTAIKGSVLAEVLLVGVVSGFASVGYVYKDQINTVLNQFSTLTEGYGPAGYALFVAVNAGLEVHDIPAIPLTMSAGLLFGSFIGTIIVSISGTVAASVAFLISRYFARQHILKFVDGNKKFLAIDKVIGKDSYWGSQTHREKKRTFIPEKVKNYSWLGMLPGTWANVNQYQPFASLSSSKSSKFHPSTIFYVFNDSHSMSSPQGQKLNRSPFRNAGVRNCLNGLNIVASTKPEPLKIMISGAPASGKGTQCELITKKYGLVHVAAGDLLRAEIATGSENGRLAKEYMEKGQLVPDQIVVMMVKDRLLKPDSMENGWLLDGYPRSSSQAFALKDFGLEPDLFLLLEEPISGKRIGNAERQEGLYILESERIREKADSCLSCMNIFPVENRKMSDKDVRLWHSRLEHPSFAYMKRLFPAMFIIKSMISFGVIYVNLQNINGLVFLQNNINHLNHFL